jgi:DNA (cytosine-5)-methyltransferase 1
VIYSEKPPVFNVIDVFAGVGGLTLGFHDATSFPGCSFTTRLMVDHDAEARAVVVRNLPAVRYLRADVHSLSGSDIRTKAGMTEEEPVHVLVGGPPCQGFSFLGKRVLDDPRNVHLIDFLRLVRELRPFVVLMENVPLIITSHDGAVIGELFEGLSDLGYASCADVLTASEYGVPQLRRRAIVLAYRADLCLPPQLPVRTHERVPNATVLTEAKVRKRYEEHKLPYVAVEEAIGDLPSLAAGGGDEVMFYAAPAASAYQTWARQDSVAAFNHRSRAHAKDFLEKISVIGEGGRNKDLPKTQRFSDNYYSQAYARLHRHGIAGTITTCFGNPGSGRFTHYSDLRAITVREAARFQSFPDLYVFEGLHSTQMRLVGNAVPPLLSRSLRDHIGKDLLAADVHKPKTVGRPRRPEPVAPNAEERSRIMRAVPGKNTSAELALRRSLSDAGVRGYRLHDRRVAGKPDLIFPRARLAVFVDGCFWHGCPSCYREPKTNQQYWTMKVKRNMDRDRKVNELCESAGWRVVRLWEHEVLREAEFAAARILKELKPVKRKAG